MSQTALVVDNNDILVKESVTKRQWVAPIVDENALRVLMQTYNLPEALARILVMRGIQKDEVPSFLQPKLQDLMPDPSLMREMDKAVDRIVEAIITKKNIVAFCDYDTDGGTSGGLASLFFKSISAPLGAVFVPSREKDGYGPQLGSFKRMIKENKPELIITMDCGSGIEAQAAILYAKEQGIETIVIDHHTAQKTSPAYAEVNPRHPDDKSGLSYLAAVGVVFMTCVAINRALRQKEWYKQQQIKEPILMDFLDIVAFGTIGDVVPLIGLNRAFVVAGLKQMNDKNKRHLALSFLLETAEHDKEVTADTVAFKLVPRTNANNRLGDVPDLIVRLFSAADAQEMNALAEMFHQLNKKRQELQGQAIRLIYKKKFHETEEPFVLLQNKDWRLGIIGVIAGQIKEDLDKVVAVLTYNKQKQLWEGSARSVPQVDLGKLVIRAVEDNILKGGGGHPMAAGFLIEEENIPLFKRYMNEAIQKQIQEKPLKRELQMTALVASQAINIDLANCIKTLEPFGAGNESPLFMVTGARIFDARVVGVGQETIICRVQDITGGSSVKAVAFRQQEESPLRRLLLDQRQITLNLAAYIEINDFNGKKTAQLRIVDAVLDESSSFI